MRLTTQAIVAVAFLSALALSSPRSALELTDSNFEHLTQAITGGTTGPWFVAFMSPSCGHCKQLQPTWDQLADHEYGHVNVGAVDVSANHGLAKRFQVRQYPTILFIHNGLMTEYKGERTVEAFDNWLQAELESRTESVAVPAEPGMLDDVWTAYRIFYDDLLDVAAGKRHVLIVMFAFGFIVGVLVLTVAIFCLRLDEIGLPKPADKPKQS